MKLTSCETCGVVIDLDQISFPPIFDKHGEFIDGNYQWENSINEYVAIVDCPVCGDKWKGTITDK